MAKTTKAKASASIGPRSLGLRERRFVEFYMANPNATEAAIKAGYSAKTAASQGSRLLRNVKIRAAIEQRAESSPAVATRKERQEFWTAVFRGEAPHKRVRMADRLKASELLGKTQADFIERHEISTPVDISVVPAPPDEEAAAAGG